MDKAVHTEYRDSFTFVEKIDGDYFNVVGLPISALADTLEDEMDIKIL